MLPQHLQLNIPSSAASTNAANPYLLDQLQFMQQQETTHYKCTEDYLHHATVTSSDRRTMASWSYDIVDACSIDREIAIIAMNYFDRFMCTASSADNNKRAKHALNSRREFQLIFITCLIIALKCRAGMQVDSDFVSDTICQGLYTDKEIIDMEREILSGLKWRLNGPSAHEFIGGLLELLPPDAADVGRAKVVASIKTMAGVQVEHAMLNYNMALRAPSSIAFAAIITAMANIGSDVFHPLDRLTWLSSIAMVTGLKADPITENISSASRSVPSSPTRDMLRYHSNDVAHVMCTPTSSSNSSRGFVPQVYCGHVLSPSSSSLAASDHSSTGYHQQYEDHLYLDTLSCSSHSDLSPVCAMLDDGLDLH